MRRPPLYQLVQIALQRDLESYVRRSRLRGIGWRTISKDLEALTDFKVSHETLRSWFPEGDAG